MKSFHVTFEDGHSQVYSGDTTLAQLFALVKVHGLMTGFSPRSEPRQPKAYNEWIEHS